MKFQTGDNVSWVDNSGQKKRGTIFMIETGLGRGNRALVGSAVWGAFHAPLSELTKLPAGLLR